MIKTTQLNCGKGLFRSKSDFLGTLVLLNLEYDIIMEVDNEREKIVFENYKEIEIYISKKDNIIFRQMQINFIPKADTQFSINNSKITLYNKMNTIEWFIDLTNVEENYVIEFIAYQLTNFKQKYRDRALRRPLDIYFPILLSTLLLFAFVFWYIFNPFKDHTVNLFIIVPVLIFYFVYIKIAEGLMDKYFKNALVINKIKSNNKHKINLSFLQNEKFTTLWWPIIVGLIYFVLDKLIK